MSTPAAESLAQGRFQLLEVLGEGGMATVYRAFDRRLQRHRAIKILAPALAQRETLRRRFLSEAQTMATLEESRVVRVFDMGEDDGRVYIVMELVDGGSLVDRLNGGGPLPPQLAAQVGVQIAESLHVAHQAGVIHRDIKPHNILLTRTGEIRITDFGIAQVNSDEGAGMTRTGAVMGTWGFMAPEQRNNAKGVDARADVFSTGATLWALLKADTPPELYAEEGAFADIPAALADVLRIATRYRREDRYPTAQMLADALREALTRLPADPEFVPPLVLPKAYRVSGPPVDTVTIDSVEDGPNAMPPTMVPDLGPDPSLSLKRTSSEKTTTAPAPDRSATQHMSLPPPRRVSMPEAIEPAPPRGTRPGVWLAFAVAGVVAFLGIALIGAGTWWLHRGAGEVPVVNGGDVAATGIGDAVPADPPVADAAVTAPPAPANPTDVAPVSAPPTVPVVPSNSGTTPSKGKPQSTQPPVVSNVDPGEARTLPSLAPTPVTPTPVAPPPAPIDTVPTLRHTPPTSVPTGGALTLTATGSPGWTVKVYYRPASGGAFHDKLMNASGGTYTTTLRATDDLAGGIEYFLQAATPDTTLKDGSASSPHRVAVGP